MLTNKFAYHLVYIKIAPSSNNGNDLGFLLDPLNLKYMYTVAFKILRIQFATIHLRKILT